ncbi:OsmC family protein [Pontibacter ruber]|uniref:OsmC family protein n=1 Tax=Pontibacter ruber TaxID=1343895 RepID=A0ABW5D1C1_9BACT|nr:OsmC family protein [Pontibacter ruber]
MNISATIRNSFQKNDLIVTTEGNQKEISIPAKAEGYGSSVNGGELLFLSLATCFCNDVYREAARRSMEISTVEVTVSGEFGKEGEPASNIVYEVHLQAPNHSEFELRELIEHVDKIAEVHNTLRRGVGVTLKA